MAGDSRSDRCKEGEEISDENKARFRQFIDELINKKNAGAIDDFVAEDYTEHNPPPAEFGVPSGREGLKIMMGMFFTAFPDLDVHIDELIAEGDTVVGRMTTSGTHKGDFMGIPATGKKATFTEMHMIRLANGKMVDHWGNSDDLGMMQQLGVIPSQPG